jgi:hypothetical protein
MAMFGPALRGPALRGTATFRVVHFGIAVLRWVRLGNVQRKAV